MPRTLLIASVIVYGRPVSNEKGEGVHARTTELALYSVVTEMTGEGVVTVSV